jgi:hypothetical protein
MTEELIIIVDSSNKNNTKSTFEDKLIRSLAILLIKN